MGKFILDPAGLLKCSKCGIYKNTKEFKIDSRSKRGFTSLCKSCYNKQPRKAHKYTWINTDKERYKTCKGGARKRSYEFLLSFEEFIDITRKPCFYCGAFNGYSGIDRFNNSVGYTLENCVPSCTNCNVSKGTKTYNEFIEHCNKIIKHQKQLIIDD